MPTVRDVQKSWKLERAHKSYRYHWNSYCHCCSSDRQVIARDVSVRDRDKTGTWLLPSTQPTAVSRAGCAMRAYLPQPPPIEQYINVHEKHKVPSLRTGTRCRPDAHLKLHVKACATEVVTQQTVSCVLNVLVKLSDVTEGVKDGARGGTGQKRERKEERLTGLSAPAVPSASTSSVLVPGVQSSVPPFTHSITGTAQKKDSAHCCH